MTAWLCGEPKRVSKAGQHPFRSVADIVVGECDDAQSAQSELCPTLLIALTVNPGGVSAMAFEFDHETAGKECVDPRDGALPVAPHLLDIRSREVACAN